MKIIIIDKSFGKGGWHARVYGTKLQSFAKTELKAIEGLIEKILEANSKSGKTGEALYRIYTSENPPYDTSDKRFKK